MLTRRALLAGGVVTGAAAGGGVDAGQSHTSSAGTDEKLVKALEDIRDLVRGASGGSGELGTIRSLQREFLKSHGKFPDFIEIGIDIWDAIMDWHIRTRQVPQVQRTAEGRYAIPVFQTNLVLRHDVSNVYIGSPYDGK
jgi:hypothetical protein